MKLYAVLHEMGSSIFLAKNKADALSKAKRFFGESAAPYRVPENQEEEVEWALSMGAKQL